MAGSVADQAALRRALDTHVHQGLRLTTGVIAALLGVFVILDLLVTPSRYAVQVALVDLFCAGLFLLAHFAYRQDSVPAKYANVVGAVLAASIVLGSLHDAYVLADAEQTMFLMLVLVGAGAIFLSLPWLGALIGLTLTGWVIVVRAHPTVNWTYFGFALFAATILAILIQIVRYQTFVRMELLRTQQADRKTQLEIRESALESAIEALQQSEERYRRLVEGAPYAFLVQSAGKVVYANHAAVKLFAAADARALEGRDAIDLFHPDARETAKARSILVETELRPTDLIEMKCVRLDGATVNVEVLGQPITFLGRPAEQLILHDITDRKRADSQKQVASQRLAEISRLKEMDAVKTQFVNTISHELRTPLTPIKVQLYIMKSAKDLDQVHRSTAVVERNILRLSGLVDELLEVARIQAGTLKLAKTYVDLSDTVQLAMESFVDVARQNDIELAIHIEPDIQVLGDAKRLQQVMYNLLGNAFKFTGPGDHIIVDVKREGTNALVSVKDTGAGLESKDAANLFEPFSQAHDTMEQTNAGTGLGLYICRGIVEGHDGRIWVDSEGKGKGARFAFTIPLADTDGRPTP